MPYASLTDPDVRPLAHPDLNTNLVKDPEEWLKAAAPSKGSCWGHWLAWLQKRSGEISAPAQLGSAAHPPLAKSPGTYALEQ